MIDKEKMAAQKLTPKEVFNKHADWYQQGFMLLDLYNDTYDDLCRSLPEKARVLEIGCGPGNITRYLLDKRPDLKLLGIDLAENMVALAKQNCPAAQFEVMDAKDIFELGQAFDAIVCGFCLPYLSKQEVSKLISDSAKMLHANGILYLSAIEDKYERSGYETSSNGQEACFIYYYNEALLHTLLHDAGFGDPIAFRKPYKKANGNSSTHLILITRKK